MRISYDAQVDCAYIYLKDIGDGEACQNYHDLVDPADIEADIVLDLDVRGQLLGVEIIGASVLLSAPEISVCDESSVSFGGAAKRRQFPVYLEEARDVLRAPIRQNEWMAPARVVRLALPLEAAGWVDLHLDGKGQFTWD